MCVWQKLVSVGHHLVVVEELLLGGVRTVLVRGPPSWVSHGRVGHDGVSHVSHRLHPTHDRLYEYRCVAVWSVAEVSACHWHGAGHHHVSTCHGHVVRHRVVKSPVLRLETRRTVVVSNRHHLLLNDWL